MSAAVAFGHIVVQQKTSRPVQFELYLAVEDIDHSLTKTKSSQTNGICERFHKTVLNEFYRVASPTYRDVPAHVRFAHDTRRHLRNRS